MLMLFLSAFVVGLSGAMMPGPLLTYTIQKALSKGWRAGFIIIAGHAVLELCLIIVIFLGFDLVLQSNAAQIAIGFIGGLLLGYMGIDMIIGALRNKISVSTLPKDEERDAVGQVCEDQRILNQSMALQSMAVEGMAIEGLAVQGAAVQMLTNQVAVDCKVADQSSAEQNRADSAITGTGNQGTGNTGTAGMILSGIIISATNPYFLMWWAIVGLGFIMQSYEAYGFTGVAVYYVGHTSVDVLWYGLISILVGTTRKFIKEKYYRIVIAILGCALVFFGLKFTYSAISSLIKLL